MKSQSNNAITLKINGQKVQINNEIKGAWFKMINNTRNTARSTHSCGQSDYRLCCGDCPLCPWKVSGIIMSFSNTHFNGDTETIPGGFVLADAAPGPDEIAESDDTVERILKYARTVCEDGDLILTMRMEGLPGKEIASRLAVPKRTMERRIKKLMAEIRDYYINFFM